MQKCDPSQVCLRLLDNEENLYRDLHAWAERTGYGTRTPASSDSGYQDTTIKTHTTRLAITRRRISNVKDNVAITRRRISNVKDNDAHSSEGRVFIRRRGWCLSRMHVEQMLYILNTRSAICSSTPLTELAKNIAWHMQTLPLHASVVHYQHCACVSDLVFVVGGFEEDRATRGPQVKYPTGSLGASVTPKARHIACAWAWWVLWMGAVRESYDCYESYESYES